MTRPIWIACGEKPAIYDRRQSPIVVQKHQQRQRKPAMALCINLWLLKTPFFARRPKHHPHPAADPPKTGHRRARHQFTFRHTPQDARSPRRTKCAARASCMSEDVPKSKLMAGPAMSGLQWITAGGINGALRAFGKGFVLRNAFRGKPVGSLRPRSSGIGAEGTKVRFAPNVGCGEGFLRPAECA